MTDSQTGETPQRRLRLWPGVAVVITLLLFRFGVKALVPGIQGFGYAVMGSLACTLLILLWWTLFSRARWTERLGGLGIILLGVGGAWLLKHPSMWLPWLFAYALPLLMVAFVGWAAFTRSLPDRVRRATMVATILIACGAWMFVRQDGINGDHNAKFGWRWAPSAEERLLAETNGPDTLPSSLPPQSTSTPTTAAPLPSPSPSASVQASPNSTAPVIAKEADWPGFRGPRRDGIVRGVKIKSDWTASPPVQVWHRAVGPGWSSFAVNGDLFYTQEQRGDEEVVACYKASTGQPVWAHKDAARFFESNAGAGPRATPTLSNGRVYTFGATGILNVLDANKGTVIWTKNVSDDTGVKVPFWGFASSPVVVGDVVIVAAAGQLVGYDIATGNRRWLGPNGGGSYSSPQLVTIDGVQQVLLMSGVGITSLSPSDGKQLWQHAWSGNSIVQPAVTTDGDVLITSQDSGARRISVAHSGTTWSASEKWTANTLKPYFNDFVIHKGHAYGFDGRILSCIDLKDGQRNWKGGRYGNGQLILLPDQDLLLVLSEEGELALVRATPDQFTEIAKAPALEGKTWNHPVLVRDTLLVRNGEQMAAFKLVLEGR